MLYLAVVLRIRVKKYEYICIRRDYKTVKSAVEAGNDGDIIVIPSGIYKEKIEYCKKVSNFGWRWLCNVDL